MEYKIFLYIRNHMKLPYFLRFILASFLIFISILPILLPLFPGSLFLGLIFLVIGLMLIVPGNKIRHVVKMRKGIVYLTKNFHKKDTLTYKIRDIKIHIRDILNERQNIKK